MRAAVLVAAVVACRCVRLLVVTCALLCVYAHDVLVMLAAAVIAMQRTAPLDIAVARPYVAVVGAVRFAGTAL
jgi:hypothetical protein